MERALMIGSLHMLFRYYRQLLEQVDRWTADMVGRYKAYLACKKGCDLCCRRKFTVSGVEAYNIAAAFVRLPAPLQRKVRKKKKSACTFLVEGACAVYDARPVICRTFGLPSLHRNEKNEGELSWCELNFTNVPEDFGLQADGIIDIDTLNVKVAGVNNLFLKESGLTAERVPMDEIPNLDTRLLQRLD